MTGTGLAVWRPSRIETCWSRQNNFAYVSGDPLRYVDPKGVILETFWDAGNLIYDIWNGTWEDAAWDAAAMCIPGVPAGMTKIPHLGLTTPSKYFGSKTKSVDNNYNSSRRRVHCFTQAAKCWRASPRASFVVIVRIGRTKSTDKRRGTATYANDLVTESWSPQQHSPRRTTRHCGG